MKHTLTIILLATALIWTLQISNTIRHDDSRPTLRAESTATQIESTPLPDCPAGEFYSIDMQRCWPIEMPALEMTIDATELEAIATYETPGCNWYQPDNSTATPVWSCP